MGLYSGHEHDELFEKNLLEDTKNVARNE